MAGVNIDDRLSLESAPRATPGLYPGWWPRESFILDAKSDEPAGTDLFYLRAGSAHSSRPGIHGDTRSAVHPETLKGEEVRYGESQSGLKSAFFSPGLTLFSLRSGSAAGSLEEFLSERGLEPMAQRTPVLAVGSNACPAQILHKFRGTGVSSSIPTLRVRLKGYGVGFVPTISRFGYVPATLVKLPGLESNLFLQFLDQEQLLLLDKSEGIEVGARHPGDYQRVEIAEEMKFMHYPATAGGEPKPSGLIDKVYGYVSTIGALALGGQLVLSDNSAFGVETTKGPALRVHEASAGLRVCHSQDELVEAVDSENSFLAGMIRASLRDGRSPSSVRGKSGLFDSNRITAGPWSSEKQLSRSWTPREQRHARKDSKMVTIAHSSKRESHVSQTEFTVFRSRDETRRDGESCVVLSTVDYESLGRPKHVAVEVTDDSGQKPAPRRAIARVLPPGESNIEAKGIEVDQVIRDAISVKCEGKVDVVALREPSFAQRFVRRLVLAIFGRPNFVTARTKYADITTMERDVALVTPLTLQMLGIEPGEFAVLEGVTPDYELKSETVRVFPLDDLTMKRRKGGKTGNEHKMPPVFIDAALRKRLLGKDSDSPGGVIRLRASVAQQVQKELREFFLILLLSILTWVLASPEGDLSLSSTAAVALIGVVFFAAVLLIGRIRWRYKHTAPSRFIRRQPRSAKR